MLKFVNNHTTNLDTFEDLILTFFVIIDDLYHHHVPTTVSKRKNIHTAKLSDSEIITISLCGELMGIDSENAWYSFIKRNYKHFFPNLCSRTRFNRTRRNLLQTTELLREKLLSLFSIQNNHYLIVDSFPLEVCKFGRAHSCHSFRTEQADYGFCPSKKEKYFGYKVHALVTLDGIITNFEITPASIDDREGLRDMVIGKKNLTIIGDKGYVGEKLIQDMKEQGICLMSLKRSNSKNNWSTETRQLIFRLRRKIETVFSQLNEQLNAERTFAKSFRGLSTRLVNKILAHNLCMILNHLFHKEFELGKIKQLIF